MQTSTPNGKNDFRSQVEIARRLPLPNSGEDDDPQPDISMSTLTELESQIETDSMTEYFDATMNQDTRRPSAKRRWENLSTEESDSSTSRAPSTQPATTEQTTRRPPRKQRSTTLTRTRRLVLKRQREALSTEESDPSTSHASIAESITTDQVIRRPPSKRQRRMPARYLD
ncbi:unnamed protein product [Rotaria magnacalcarata]|uniref:Uncharacterized protein n=1 Tax=Rotaria magnacalcarata TaxID=392030 RepID=A0A815WZV0_9BILA|nr:unnamed protein product [Rotaria magnacalcarata]CAF4105053.1 unnamed protein product [Rotaria magnacalcarata]